MVDTPSKANKAQEDAAAPSFRLARAGDADAVFQPIRKAYEQVADQLRALIAQGHLAQGERLPNEVALASDFGVSRSTIREALRLLAAQQLIKTSKGVGGGSFVTVPTVDDISEYVRENITLLTELRHVSLEEFLEARNLLEVSAARMCAERRDQQTLDDLSETLVHAPGEIAARDRFGRNWHFHSVVIQSCGNALLSLAAQPIFAVLQTHLSRTTMTEEFLETAREQHVLIADAITAGDPEAASEEMRRHLDWLRPSHEQWWKYR